MRLKRSEFDISYTGKTPNDNNHLNNPIRGVLIMEDLINSRKEKVTLRVIV